MKTKGQRAHLRHYEMVHQGTYREFGGMAAWRQRQPSKREPRQMQIMDTIPMPDEVAHLFRVHRPVECVYFLQASLSQYVKIGYTSNLYKRLHSISTTCPEGLEVLGILRGRGRETEQELHRRLAEDRVRGEWFRPSEQVLGLASGALVLTIAGIRPSKTVSVTDCE